MGLEPTILYLEGRRTHNFRIQGLCFNASAAGRSQGRSSLCTRGAV